MIINAGTPYATRLHTVKPLHIAAQRARTRSKYRKEKRDTRQEIQREKESSTLLHVYNSRRERGVTPLLQIQQGPGTFAGRGAAYSEGLHQKVPL